VRPQRLAALREVAKDADTTVNQVVLAWLIGAEVPMIPLIGASSAAQLDESLAAVDLELTPEQRAAGRGPVTLRGSAELAERVSWLGEAGPLN
jgi:aryl-alcohol dehydrogenase-like predicted oxidoreductase